MWTPGSPHLLGLNFVGVDASLDHAEAYVFEDDQIPFLVIGALSLLELGAELLRRVEEGAEEPR